ncbi:alpha-(1-_3)-arabinofuranosyltransferase [Allonocardiopsis opalescens]|uniref:Arabinofuranan 3-O-arabinosyltransferase n=1 Tax=Allonocardiopsis opalescens TaxID=1144618 RepID=A0A2T0QCI0_9ACTN|nr:alpha-(1->3)-arabinofuranosyltransferase [Allonocardiopsis opalescens]PRY01581.1 arabinofuranan 3-O-arabinosyltransferase [Allonocardiopsis opalescens]
MIRWLARTGGRADGAGPGPGAPGPDPVLVRRLSLLAVCLLLAAIAFSTEPGRIVGDTKLDLTIDPLGFLGRALYLWDPAYFGQLQNQAYGYLFPNGPFHALLIALDMPEWAVQRLWMALLLCAAFTGTVQVARALGIGGLHTQILAGLAYALAPRVLTLISANSAELQPTMLLPWILLPLVTGAREGRSPLRAAALSACAFLLCGGTNAASELAVLVVPLLFLLTRAPGPRRRRLTGWWLTAIAMVSCWWLVPLLIMGRYVYSFMPFTEDAATTTSVTSLTNVLRGTTNWMGFLPVDGRPWLPAGWELAVVPWLVVVTAVLAGLGLAGLLAGRLPERTFLVATLLTGVAILAGGHVGEVAGVQAEFVRNLLDGPLSPFRNVHKFDALVRLPLVLGLANLPAAARAVAWRRALLGCGAAAVALSAVPAVTVGVAPRGSFEDVPAYWRQAVDWLNAEAGGAMALAVPGSGRGEYLWGRPMDEPLQPLSDGRWSNHMVIPWGSAGISRLQHELDARLSSGEGSAGLTSTLARMGVGYLVVRNDLDRAGLRGAYPAQVHSALESSPGIHRVAEFGPVVGVPEGGTQAGADWIDQPYPAVEIYQVEEAAPLVGTVPAEDALRVTGGPEALLALAEEGVLDDDRPVILGDDPGAEAIAPEATVVTDTLRRRETAFADVRRNDGPTLTAAQERSESGPVSDVLDPAWEPYTSVAAPLGAAVTASSSAADLDASGARRDAGRSPFAAVDGDPGTAWRPGAWTGPVGEWIEIEFAEPLDLSEITVAFEHDPWSPAPSRIELATDAGRSTVPVQATDRPQRLSVPEGTTERLRLRIDALDWEPAALFGVSAGIAEIEVPGVEVARTVEVPGVEGASTTVLTGSGSVPACVEGSVMWTCSAAREVLGEDGYGFDRTFPVSGALAEAGGARVSGRVTVTDPAEADMRANALAGGPDASVSSVAGAHPAGAGWAALDGDPSTAWYADPGEREPRLELDFGRTVDLGETRFVFARPESVSAPVRVSVAAETAEGTRVAEGYLSSSGELDLGELRAEQAVITFTPPLGQPLELAEVEIGGVEPREVPADRPIPPGCGLGPTLEVDGTPVRTEIVDGTVGELLAGRPLEYASCEPVPLTGGEARLAHSEPGVYRLESAVVESASAPLPGGGGEPVELGGADVISWGPSSREVHVFAEEDGYLVVNENFNEGWQATAGGRELVPVRLDGWRQAWELPAGTYGTVTMRYTPDTAYQLALGVGAGLVGGLLFLLAAAHRIGGAALPAARPGRPRLRLLVPLTVALGAWTAGAAGVVVLGAALTLALWPGWVERRSRWLTGPWPVLVLLTLAGGSLGLAGALGAAAPESVADALGGWVPQLLCLPVLARLAVALRPRPAHARRPSRPPRARARRPAAPPADGVADLAGTGGGLR